MIKEKFITSKVYKDFTGILYKRVSRVYTTAVY